MHNDPPDLELTIRQCRRGNPLAWEVLVKNYQARVYAVSFYYLRNRVEAQEAAQEVFIKVFHGLQGFKGTADGFHGWLMAIARNCCLDRLRAAKVRDRYAEEYEESQADALPLTESPEAIAARQQRQRLLYQALGEFNATNRDILLLKDIQGLKLEQVAEILSLPVGTVKSRSNRARIELAKRLSELVDDYPESSGAI